MGDTRRYSVAYQRIYDRMLAKADEYKDVVLLAFHHGPGQMYNTSADHTLKDLTGSRSASAAGW